jgi:3',5'-cyclic AMP phosphodiesterase CpdA
MPYYLGFIPGSKKNAYQKSADDGGGNASGGSLESSRENTEESILVDGIPNAFGDDIDLLVLNGDISDHSSSVQNISMIYQIASGITEGRRPCIYSRGNHDMRGAFAEHLAEEVVQGVHYNTISCHLVHLRIAYA